MNALILTAIERAILIEACILLTAETDLPCTADLPYRRDVGTVHGLIERGLIEEVTAESGMRRQAHYLITELGKGALRYNDGHRLEGRTS